MTSPQLNEIPRNSRAKIRKNKHWIRELLVGVSGTVIGAIVLAAMGLNPDGPSKSESGRLPTAQVHGPIAAGSVSVSSMLSVASSLTSPPNEPPVVGFDPTIPSHVDGQRTPGLLGKWEQWIYHPIHAKWYSGGIYRVTIRQQKLSMSILDNTNVDSDVINSQGLTDVAYSGGLWTFASQLEIGELLHFQLRSVDEDTFSGYCYQNGEALTANTWRRVK